MVGNTYHNDRNVSTVRDVAKKEKDCFMSPVDLQDFLHHYDKVLKFVRYIATFAKPVAKYLTLIHTKLPDTW